MFESDLARQILLGLTAAVFALLALRSAWVPDSVARELGYTLDGANAYSELHAIYVGLWLAHAGLGLWAMLHVEQAVLGDILALLVLGQPLGRLLALPRHGWPQGPLLVFFALEVVGGVALLCVRPAG
ncbi:MAG: DUF4345 family protein [Rhodanobacteraceae bacterium]|nr:DUF4345 family protein [Rhodanobacteraceae bacterium]